MGSRDKKEMSMSSRHSKTHLAFISFIKIFKYPRLVLVCNSRTTINPVIH